MHEKRLANGGEKEKRMKLDQGRKARSKLAWRRKV